MRMKKNETIAHYKNEFLAGKSDEYKQKFEEKDENKQYTAIMNWKRSAKKLGEATEELAKVTAGNVVTHLKNAHKMLTNVSGLSAKEAMKLQQMLDSFKDTINNFDRVKKAQLIETLKSQQAKLQKQGEDLSKQIEKLQQELG